MRRERLGERELGLGRDRGRLSMRELERAPFLVLVGVKVD